MMANHRLQLTGDVRPRMMDNRIRIAAVPFCPPIVTRPAITGAAR